MFEKKQISMDQYRISIENIISMMELDMDVHLSSRLDQQTRGMVLHIVANLYAKDHKETVEDWSEKKTVEMIEFVSVPASWWQHFKKEWFPLWALNRWPVKERFIEVKLEREVEVKHVVNKHVTKICPHIKLDRQARHLSWIAGDQRWDEVEEEKELHRLRRFVLRLVREVNYPDNLCYDCSPRVIEEAKKALEGKS